MKYYPRYPADYAAATRGMTLIDHGAYTMLLDTLYGTEQPLPEDLATLYRICGAITKAEQAAVRRVLTSPSLNWSLGTNGWIQKRAWEEISKWQAKIARLAENGKRGGRPIKNGKVTPIGKATSNPFG